MRYVLLRLHGLSGWGVGASTAMIPIPPSHAAAIPRPPAPPPRGLPQWSLRGLFVPFARLRSPPSAPPGGLMCLSLLCALLFAICGSIRIQQRLNKLFFVNVIC